jgi:hypothetical protein
MMLGRNTNFRPGGKIVTNKITQLVFPSIDTESPPKKSPAKQDRILFAADLVGRPIPKNVDLDELAQYMIAAELQKMREKALGMENRLKGYGEGGKGKSSSGKKRTKPRIMK